MSATTVMLARFSASSGLVLSGYKKKQVHCPSEIRWNFIVYLNRINSNWTPLAPLWVFPAHPFTAYLINGI